MTTDRKDVRDQIPPEQRFQELRALEQPSLEDAQQRREDMEYLEKHTHWRDGVPDWCQRWADLIGTSPAMIMSTVAWRSIAKAYAKAWDER